MSEKEQQNIFENWLRQYKALIFKVVRAYAFERDDQDDLFQEIAIQIWRSIINYRKESAVTTWLYRVALNTAIKWTQREQKHREEQNSLKDAEYLVRTQEHVDERLDWLYDQIAKMEEIDRSLTLLLLDGFNYKEMSEILGISESNVGVKIHRIKKQLITQSEIYTYHGT